MTPAIRLRNVSKRFRVPLDRSSTLKYRVVHPRSSSRHRDLYALNDITFDVPHGQFLGIVGHNGCGKSTLLKVLSRIYPPTSGVAEVSGPVSPFLELGVGFNPELTARENVYLNGAVLGLTRSEVGARMKQIIQFAELEDFTDQKLKNFSSGMQVRLAFSVAIQADAGILLMDEVLAVGDARFQDKCFDIFASYRRRGRTVVLVTHDLQSVDQYCDRCILLDHGRMVADGGAAEVTALYRRMVGHQSESDTVNEGKADLDRWGSGEMRIVDVGLEDAEGMPHRTFTTGEPMRIRIDFRTHEPVDEVVCGIAIHRSDGAVVAGTNTHIAGLEVHCPPRDETGRVVYEIPVLPLLSGSYAVSVALHARYAPYPYDHMEQTFQFRVVDETTRAGIVDVGGHWRVTDPPSGHRTRDVP